MFQYDSDISAYTVERTLDMEKRANMLRDMKLKQRRPTVSTPVTLVTNFKPEEKKRECLGLPIAHVQVGGTVVQK